MTVSRMGLVNISSTPLNYYHSFQIKDNFIATKYRYMLIFKLTYNSFVEKNIICLQRLSLQQTIIL